MCWNLEENKPSATKKGLPFLYLLAPCIPSSSFCNQVAASLFVYITFLGHKSVTVISVDIKTLLCAFAINKSFRPPSIRLSLFLTKRLLYLRIISEIMMHGRIVKNLQNRT